MYQDYYQLKENPFNVTADPAFFFSNKSHCEAISSLTYGVEQRKGILVITGEIGTGKTTICRKLLNQSNSKTRFALILYPNFSDSQLLHVILEDLGIPIKQKNKFNLIQQLNQYLIAESNLGNNVVLVIDEAQKLTVKQLEQIRLLSNLETEKEKLLQIILIGQPELYAKLKLPSLRQLKQRIAVYFHLNPLEKTDIKNYIVHRINVAKKEAINTQLLCFSDSAIETIYRYTHGYPRTINMLCDRILLAGFVSETRLFDQDIVEACAKEILYCEYNL